MQGHHHWQAFCCEVWPFWLCVFICVDFQSVFGAGTPVASFPVARREPAFRLLFNKPADRAYWLWMDRDPRWEKQWKRKRGKGGEEKRREVEGRCRERSRGWRWKEDAGTKERKTSGMKGNRVWKHSHVASAIWQFIFSQFITYKDLNSWANIQNDTEYKLLSFCKTWW